MAQFVGKVMRETREGAGLKQKDAAAIINVSQSTMCRIESGEIPLGLESFLELCKAYGSDPAIVISRINQEESEKN